MKKFVLTALAIAACFSHAQAQNVEGQIIAAQYGEFKVPGQTTGGTFSFAPDVCQVSGGNKPFSAFATGRAVKIVDGNPSLTEIATPSSVFISQCAVNMATTYTHVPPYYLTSGTGGLQEAITANQQGIAGPNSIILNAEWYSLIAPRSAAVVIASVTGNTNLPLVDVTSSPYTSYQWNGTQYVVTTPSGGSVNYNQGAAGAVTRTSTAKWQDSISIKDFGAVGGNLAADTAGLQAAVAAATAAGKSVYVPAGSYLLNNSSGPALSGANNVVIWGDGPASSLACNTVGAADCIASTGATGFGLANLSVSFTPTATTRSSGYAVDIETCTTCSLESVSLNNGDLSGLRLASSTHTWIKNLKVSNFEANGTFMINNQDLRLDGLTCANDGDACFETSWFDSEYTAHSIPCENITATNITSTNDVEAVLVNACRNVTVDGFGSIGSAKEAVFVGQDPTTTTAHWPDRVNISNGTIYGSGYGTNPLNVATAQALYVNVGTNPSGFISHIAFSNIQATHISSWGLQMAELQNDDVQASNLQFYDVGNGNNTGCLQTQGNQVNLNAVFCTDVGTYGLYDQNTVRLTGTGLNFNASSQVSGTDAIYLANTATGFVNLTNVSVNDTNATTFSSEIFDASTTGQHAMWNISITGLTTTGYLAPTAANGQTTYTYTDSGHSMVFRNGGMIQSFVPPNYYFLPTAGATPTSYVNGAVLYYQSKCWASGAQQTESIGWLDLYPTLTTESFALNHTGGCGFPIVVDLTAAATLSAPLVTATSFNNVALTTPASLATLGLASGITFNVSKGMTLTCSTCGTYNLDSFSGGSVSSVFGRTGAVTATSGDYAVAQVTGAAPLASPTFTGTLTTPALTVSGITGATQCLQVSSSGALSGTGSACGSGGGAVNSVTNSDGTLTISPTTGSVIASMALGHANTWTATQTLSGLNLSGVTGATQCLQANSSGVVSGSGSACGSGGGTTTNALTMNNSGSGAASGATFNGSAPQTISYNTIGAQQALTLTTTGTSGAATLSGGTLNIPQYSGGTGSSALSAVTAATTGSTINSGNNLIQWNWDLTGTPSPEYAFTISENTASTAVANPLGLMNVSTLSGSTLIPLTVQSSPTGSQTLPTLNILPNWNTTGNVLGGIYESVTDAASGSGSLMLELLHNTVNAFSVDKSGNGTFGGTVTANSFVSSNTVNNSEMTFTTGSSGDSTCPSATSGTSYLCTKSSGISASLNGAGYAPIGLNLRGTLTLTAAGSDAATVTGATSSSVCVFSATNSTAATNIASTFISAVAANAVTVTHVATSDNGGTLNILCTQN
jgi:hypothetical protein